MTFHTPSVSLLAALGIAGIVASASAQDTRPEFDPHRPVRSELNSPASERPEFDPNRPVRSETSGTGPTRPEVDTNAPVRIDGAKASAK